MTFPLGSLLSGASARPASSTAAADTAPPWRTRLWLLATAVLWLLAVLAMATHSPDDPAFSTSGIGGGVSNRAGMLGAWFSDLMLFLFGRSAWWWPLIALRAWLGALADA
ncbi:MAG: DNA translocase FtsK 4TM domain-containing protein, partial [Rhizobacter sp.]